MKRILILLLSILLTATLSYGYSNFINQLEEDEEYITTESGLKYRDIIEGIGRTPLKGQKLIVHYTGYLENGKKFDSSYDRDEPFEFVLGTGKVIKGWEEGLATMKAGGKRKLIVPPQLAYGSKGIKNSIPPDATLIFEIELLSIRFERSIR
jgi:peptidylprolyl isomerase